MLAECFLSQLAVGSDANSARFVRWCLRGQDHQWKSVLARMVAPFIGGGALPFF